MIIPEKNLMKLANGSDVRGVAIEGVADEPVTLSCEAANVITSGFLDFLADKTGKKKKVNESSKLTAYKKIIDGLIFVQPREIPIRFDGEVGICQRPLRAQTLQGERVALAMSEEIPAGAEIEFDVVCLADENEATVREWLDYGILRGSGQWRNSGKGRFSYTAD